MGLFSRVLRYFLRLLSCFYGFENAFFIILLQGLYLAFLVIQKNFFVCFILFQLAYIKFFVTPWECDKQLSSYIFLPCFFVFVSLYEDVKKRCFGRALSFFLLAIVFCTAKTMEFFIQGNLFLLFYFSFIILITMTLISS